MKNFAKRNQETLPAKVAVDLVDCRVKNYMRASHYAIDPAANMANLEIESTPEAIKGREEYFKMIKVMTDDMKARETFQAYLAKD